MLVVLSLNIESTFHIRRNSYQNIQKHDDSLKNKLFEQQCETCNQDSLSILTRFSIEGALLAAFLATFSFMLAIKTDIFAPNYKWFIPVSYSIKLI